MIFADQAKNKKIKLAAMAATVLLALAFCLAAAENAQAAVDYKLIINCGENTNSYTMSTAEGVDANGLPLVRLTALANGTGAGLGWYNTGYGGVLVWGRAESPIILLIGSSRIYTLNDGVYVPTAGLGTPSTKNGASYVNLALTEQLGFKQTVDKANRTITLEMAECTAANTDEIYAAAKDTLMSYLNPPVYWLGSATTYYKTSMRDRTTNLTIASAALNNVVIKPGQEFSFNKVVGARTPAKGYKKAIIFSGGGQVMGYGGGVCQVSTTVYQAAKKAGLQITERHSHSQRISYAKLGNDATVSYGSKDFRFKNNQGANIYIKTSISGGALSISFYRGNLPTAEAKYLNY